MTTVSLSGAVCSRQNSDGTESSSLGGPDANVAAADMGGAVEELTGNYGPGFTGRLLIDGQLKPTWKLDATASEEKVPYPQEAVFSFYERNPALIRAVAISIPNPSFAPKDVEVWTSMDAASDRYTRVSAVALAAKTGEQSISFTPVDAKFVKLRIVSGVTDNGLEIAEIKVIEASRSGYTPLFARAPFVKFWKGSPREAAQRGLDWLQQAAPTWAQHHKCFGCHVQAQALMGQAVALKHGYRVNFASVKALNEDTRTHYKGEGWDEPDAVTKSVFAAIAVAYAADVLDIADDRGMFGDPAQGKGALLRTADRLVGAMRKDGAVPVDHVQPPIVQGEFMTTANTLVSLKRAGASSATSPYSQAAARAVAWIAAHEPDSTQDKVFKVVALMHHGTLEHKRSAWSVVERLTAEQMPDGGWKEKPDSLGSNAFATGQVLYAFKQAGLSIHGEVFKRGVDFLLRHQINKPGIADGDPPIRYLDGSWPVMYSESESGFQSTYAPTMWAVIGLAGSFSAEPTGALQIVKRKGNKPPARNLEIVLDVSGSMNTRLGGGTRWTTALGVFERVVAQLPPDHNVGLRVYGHRHSSKSEETCTDTELVVPIEPLDRQKMISTVSRLRPRGETPLIRSILETIGDLKAAGGGSVILITDGEESCGGDATAAAAEIKASGLNLTLDIVGFTITGQETQAALGALAGSTGGRYYSAQDGAQLARAVMLAALQRLPYDILDPSGRVIVSGETSELSRELPPGTYRLRINAHGQVLDEPISITANQTTSLTLDVDGDRFVIRRESASERPKRD
jgi:hypothetical protein